MIDVTNLSRASLGYVTGKTSDGEPKVTAVEPGETKSVAVEADHPPLVADVAAGLAALGKPAAKPKPAAKAE